MKKLIYILTFSLVACSGEPTLVEEQLKHEDSETHKDSVEVMDTIKQEVAATEKRMHLDEDFMAFYQKFTQAIIDKDLDKTNECIHPDGLYFIETDGAMPHLQKVYDVKAFKTNKPTTFFNLSYIEIEKQPVFETLPKAICAGEVYDKYGCFAEEVNTLKESGIWNYSGFNEKEIQAVQAAAENINLTVRNTQNFTYYFSKTEQGWKLIFMDIRTPCSA